MIAQQDIARQTVRAVQGPTIIVGLGRTGLSCARFLATRGEAFMVADSRQAPPGREELQREQPNTEICLGAFDPAMFVKAGKLIVSPGVSLDAPAIVAARRAGVPVLGDIELFARAASAPVAVITGSNGKSTVTTLLAEMGREAGRTIGVGGNIGTPALELVDSEPDLYVLELSSFQLETTESLETAAATVLNVSDDHLDRHGDIATYAAIKQRVFNNGGDSGPNSGGVMVINRDDPLVAAMADPKRRVISFGESEGADYHLIDRDGSVSLARRGEPLMDVSGLRIAGRHNWLNALAALALGEAVDLPINAMLMALKRFPGLPHRCQQVAEKAGVRFFNDSKGTNVGATLAAVAGMPGKRVVLIAGGLGKGADFQELAPILARRGRAAVLLGRDAALIARVLDGIVPIVWAASMDEAVSKASGLARSGDAVLLSPACASFDMYGGYAERGEAFVEAVGRLPA
ncbi:UDP-N-acetylmuramoyl-L-alanine--D-glutamate ligase [Thiohalomonas denitrificans]|uniref:UDP-N-acetylmuramoyl-L-alanine--D-glutamate ligase n=1 Tax=Thiohalomonas denitrificans TaxID=415747 RepID=UPI0026E9A839|nr:UDP-N-acetylmuramoyl-L-alanine--D-glutamate ligase [Thiohalomonas denitrificans]